MRRSRRTHGPPGTVQPLQQPSPPLPHPHEPPHEPSHWPPQATLSPQPQLLPQEQLPLPHPPQQPLEPQVSQHCSYFLPAYGLLPEHPSPQERLAHPLATSRPHSAATWLIRLNIDCPPVAAHLEPGVPVFHRRPRLAGLGKTGRIVAV
jgi:hypothetical protein